MKIKKKNSKDFIKNYFNQVALIANLINVEEINQLVYNLKKLKIRKGRLFILGVGGSAGNASHAVNDFRKLCNIEAYSPTDNTSELTARINDEGWETSFMNWLEVSRLNRKDSLLIFSVGGGSKFKKISVNLIKALDFAKKKGAKVFGIIGKKSGYVKKRGDMVIVVPEINTKLTTPFSESYQSIIWHCLVSHPLLQERKTKW